MEQGIKRESRWMGGLMGHGHGGYRQETRERGGEANHTRVSGSGHWGHLGASPRMGAGKGGLEEDMRPAGLC